MSSPGDLRDDISDFLTTRRARITPDEAGLQAYGGKRRVSGLRREEVAMLAGISIQYYTRLERGDARGVSDNVLDALARALRLDEVERAHLVQLVRTANAGTRPVRRKATPERVRPSVQTILDSMSGTAAFLRNGRLDVLAANALGSALYAPLFSSGGGSPNLARFVFLDPAAQDFYVDWDSIARAAVGSLRAEAGRDPYSRAVSELVGELSLRSNDFRVRWGSHDVSYYRTGVQPFRHPLVGELTLDYNALELPADPGQTIVAYTARPGTADAEALERLRSWAVDDLSGRTHR